MVVNLSCWIDGADCWVHRLHYSLCLFCSLTGCSGGNLYLSSSSSFNPSVSRLSCLIKPFCFTAREAALNILSFSFVHVSFLSFPHLLPLYLSLSLTWPGHPFTPSLFSSLPPLFSTPLFSSHLVLLCPPARAFLSLSPPAPFLSLNRPSLRHLLTVVHSCQTWQWIVSRWPNQNSVWVGHLLKVIWWLLLSSCFGAGTRGTDGQTDRREPTRTQLLSVRCMLDKSGCLAVFKGTVKSNGIS